MKFLAHILVIVSYLLHSNVCSAQLLDQETLNKTRVYRNLVTALQYPDSVYRLDLSKQKLRVFPDEIFQFKNLNELVLDKNRIQVLPENISSLQFLQILSSQHNELYTLPKGIFHLSNLRKLDVADNEITTIPDHFDELQQLEILSLWDNPIESYPESMSELGKLKYLDLLHNQINFETQDRLRSMLPGVKIIMSPPCNCQDGEE